MKNPTDVMAGAAKLALEQLKEAAEIAEKLPKEPADKQMYLVDVVLIALAERNWTRAQAALHLLQGMDKPDGA